MSVVVYAQTQFQAVHTHYHYLFLIQHFWLHILTEHISKCCLMCCRLATRCMPLCYNWTCPTWSTAESQRVRNSSLSHTGTLITSHLRTFISFVLPFTFCFFPPPSFSYFTFLLPLNDHIPLPSFPSLFCIMLFLLFLSFLPLFDFSSPSWTTTITMQYINF